MKYESIISSAGLSARPVAVTDESSAAGAVQTSVSLLPSACSTNVSLRGSIHAPIVSPAVGI